MREREREREQHPRSKCQRAFCGKREKDVLLLFSSLLLFFHRAFGYFARRLLQKSQFAMALTYDERGGIGERRKVGWFLLFLFPYFFLLLHVVTSECPLPPPPSSSRGDSHIVFLASCVSSRVIIMGGGGGRCLRASKSHGTEKERKGAIFFLNPT